MDYNELKEIAEKRKVEIDSFHLFYEDFNKYDVAISLGNGVLSEMYSELLKAKVKNPNNQNVINQEQRIKDLFGILEEMQGLNSKCQSLKLRFRNLNQRNFNLQHELEAIKSAHEQI